MFCRKAGPGATQMALHETAYRIPLRVVFYREDEEWVAHCLEFDVLGSGTSRQAALDDLEECIDIQIEFSVEHNNPANLFRPAPGEYHQMFARGRDVAEGELQIRFPARVDGLMIAVA